MSELARALRPAIGADLIAGSVLRGADCTVALAHARPEARLVAVAERAESLAGFEGARQEIRLEGRRHTLALCDPTESNARALRAAVPALAPRPLGTALSVGCGDRLGLATPGHVRAVRGSGLAPVLAQQSIREMERSRRTPGEVMANAVYGALREGWAEGFGADADHLKHPEHVDRCLAAGFTLYTLDPSDCVADDADDAPTEVLRRGWDALDWAALETTPGELRARYADRVHVVSERLTLTLDGEDLLRAAVKYGGAVAHSAALARHLRAAAGGRAVEIEVSVDETRAPTSAAEHYFVARELRRLGVEWVALAPRFPGEFEKGVDYRGDRERFRAAFAQHAEIARALGGYKLSLHSGSDKFSIYGICAELAEDRLHLKTAGTSYLEALRCVARVDPALFRGIWTLALERYAADRASYQVSADAAREARAAECPDAALADLLDRDGPRQILHVTFGSVLGAASAGGGPTLRDRLRDALRKHEEAYAEGVAAHFRRHLAPFAAAR